MKRQEKEDAETEIIWDLEVSNVIPDALYNLIAWIICKLGDTKITITDRVIWTASEHEKVLNISQDIMLYVTKVQMPKQIGLAQTVLRQTRSRDVVTFLNRTGHSISYHEAKIYNNYAQRLSLLISKKEVLRSATLTI